MKVKIFRLMAEDDGWELLEKRINAWMSKNDFEIFDISQSESTNEDFHYVTITIFYRKAE